MASIGYLEVFFVVVSFVLINRIANKGGLPKAWPIFGLMPQFVLHINDFHEWVSEIMEGSDRNFLARGFAYLHSDMLFTVDPKNINFMLTVDFENFPKGPEYKRIFEVLGDGIFNSDFLSWKSQRRMAQSFLSHSKTLSFLGEVMREKVENVLAKMLDEFSERCTIIDLQDLFDRLSLDVTCKLVTGFDQESLRIDLPGLEFSKALIEVEDAIFHRHVFPECTWKLLKMLGIGMERKLERSWQILDETAAAFIKLRRESLKNGVGQSEAKQGIDMLKSYITRPKGTDIIEQEDDGEDQFLRDTILNFMIAGRDTVSSALTWFFAMLSMNPLVESKIREEIDSLMMNENTLDLPLLEKMIPKMVYLHGALCESLRLYPPVPFQHKHPVKPVTLPSGHNIGPGMKVLVPLYAMGRMKSTWGEDSLEVKPERWITERGGIRHEPSYKFLAFNAGPRTCIGKEVALRQVKTIIAFIIHNYDVRVMEGQRLKPNNSIILRIRDGLRARIRKRRSGLS